MILIQLTMDIRFTNEDTKTPEPRPTCANEARWRWFSLKKPQAASWQMEAQYGCIAQRLAATGF